MSPQRLRNASLTLGNLAHNSATRREHTETGLSGWGGRTRTSQWRNQKIHSSKIDKEITQSLSVVRRFGFVRLEGVFRRALMHSQSPKSFRSILTVGLAGKGRELVTGKGYAHANGMVRPCSGPASQRSWQGAPKTRSTPCQTSSILE